MSSTSIIIKFVYIYSASTTWASQLAQWVKNPPANAGDLGSIPRLGRSPGERQDNPLQCSCLEKPMAEEPGAMDWATAYGVRYGTLFHPLKVRQWKKSKRPDLMELNTLLRRKLKCSIPDSDKHLQKENKTRNGQWTSDDQDQENVRDKIRQLEVAKMVNGISAKSCTHTLWELYHWTSHLCIRTSHFPSFYPIFLSSKLNI